MTRYQLRLRYASGPLARFNSTPLTEEVLASFLPVGTQYFLTPLVDGYELALDLGGRDHAQTMADLASALTELGFGVAQATIIEFASSWLEGSAIGTLGGAALGAATKSAEGFLLLTFAGLILGAIAGGVRGFENARYFATPTASGWEIVRQDDSPPAAGTEPAF
jgi:hypothetical protein